MAEFVFSSSGFKRGLAVAKIIKPESGDFCFKFSETSLTIFCYDKRRYVCAVIAADSCNGVPEGFRSDEFYLTADRMALFDTELSYIDIKVNDKSLSIRTYNDTQERKASLKKRAIRSKRPAIPDISFDGKPNVVSRKAFEQLLHQVSCAAQVKETKTEEDMRINQVHFYPDEECAVSNARFYGSVAFMSGMNLDVSIVSSDIPAIRTFCSKSDGSIIQLFQDKKKLYVVDPDSGSVFSMGKVASSKPKLTLLDSEKFETEIAIDQGQLVKNLGWASVAIEGTQRLGFRASKSSERVEFFFDKNKISEFPVKFIKGETLDADFPVKFFLSIISYLGGEVRLRYHHADVPTILEIAEHSEDETVKSVHYLQSMRMR